MNLHITDAQSLALIDQEISDHQLSPAEYEIVRQIIYSTADFDYLHLLRCSENALFHGAAAIAARTPIIVDVPMIQVSLVPLLQQTFCNSVYCCATAVTRPPTKQTKAAWGLENLAKQHPNAIYVIGQDQTALTTLVQLIDSKTIQPALAIATPPLFFNQEQKQWLENCAIPCIYLDSRKGGALIAASIIKSLVALAWQAY
ncbi:precorrin-8X methylmutase [Stanieria sp. NIES-3757]|nr:precorrin-8X methylmutase [Stanieria sp. NIES-3757]